MSVFTDPGQIAHFISTQEFSPCSRPEWRWIRMLFIFLARGNRLWISGKLNLMDDFPESGRSSMFCFLLGAVLAFCCVPVSFDLCRAFEGEDRLVRWTSEIRLDYSDGAVFLRSAVMDQFVQRLFNS